MASTISAATMTVEITEKIILNGRDQGATNKLSISSIKDVSKRIVTVPASGDTTGLKSRGVQDRGVDKFVAGDVLTMYANYTAGGNITGQVDNINITVEVTYDS